jgi:hypothetical protein
MRGVLQAAQDYVRTIVVLALVVVLLVGACVAGFLEALWPGVGVNFTVGVAGWFRAVPDPYYQLVGAGYVTYALAKSYDKAAKVRAENQYGPTSNVIPDDPEGG